GTRRRSSASPARRRPGARPGRPPAVYSEPPPQPAQPRPRRRTRGPWRDGRSGESWADHLLIGEERLDFANEHLTIHDPDPLEPHDPVAVGDHGLGHAREPVIDGGARPRVEERRILLSTHLLQPRPRVAHLIIVEDAEEHDAAGAMLAGHGDERRMLDPARDAPGRPEIEADDLPAVVTQPDRVRRFLPGGHGHPRQGEVRRRLPGDRWRDDARVRAHPVEEDGHQRHGHEDRDQDGAQIHTSPPFPAATGYVSAATATSRRRRPGSTETSPPRPMIPPPIQIHTTIGSMMIWNVAEEPSRSKAMRLMYRSSSGRVRTAGVVIGSSRSPSKLSRGARRPTSLASMRTVRSAPTTKRWGSFRAQS